MVLIKNGCCIPSNNSLFRKEGQQNMWVYHIDDNLFDLATRQPLNRSATKYNPERHLLVTSIKELDVFVLLNIHFRPQGCLWNHNKAQVPFNVLRLILVLFLAAYVIQ